jgi:hypothetical protein
MSFPHRQLYSGKVDVSDSFDESVAIAVLFVVLISELPTKTNYRKARCSKRYAGQNVH